MSQELIASLPEHLRERCCGFGELGSLQGKFILYWMRTAMRVDENPALDVSMLLANRLQIPLIVYQGLSERYPYASDRHHRFILEGVADLQEQFAALEILYAFHLERPEDRRPHLRSLAEKAAVVITEDIPIDPPRRFLRALTCSVPSLSVIFVDTACVVPMQIVGRPFTRAFEYREATRKALANRIDAPWPARPDLKITADEDLVSFVPLRVQHDAIPDLIAACEIDHSIGPVWDTPGGATNGYARWNEFLSKKIHRYAADRNDPLKDGSSRLSAYLHYGMVSPMRIARDAAALKGEGPKKFLDELLIWRELAYAYCHYRSDFSRLSTLPAWARQSLETHASDPRDRIMSWEGLARGKTGDPLWDAAQMSLLRFGELHNNVRMTWGKALLQWTKHPRDALRLLVDLNHRYALDGRDPASYGGFLWCLGQFDRPFEPEQPILGRVRPRPSADHAQRLAPRSFRSFLIRTRGRQLPSVAVIGGGISGLIAARTLVDQGYEVQVFDKGRAVGGRMASRVYEVGPVFDHGAQYFTVRDSLFHRYVESWIDQGLVALWPERLVSIQTDSTIQPAPKSKRYVGVPSMRVICQHLAKSIDVRNEVQVDQVRSDEQGVTLIAKSEQRLGTFDQCIIAVPVYQAIELLRFHAEQAAALHPYEMQPCWSVMIELEDRWNVDWQAAFVAHPMIAWIARNQTKPGRKMEGECLTVHATHEWSLANLEMPVDAVAERICDATWDALQMQRPRMSRSIAHRWRYAIPTKSPNTSIHRCLSLPNLRIQLCGDWLCGPRIESAFLSGVAAAGRLLGTPSEKKSEFKQLGLFS